MRFRTKRADSSLFPNGEWVLLLALLAEAAVFSAIAPGFFTWANLFEILRFSVELGLLAVALTPIIIAGGIDLSVGSIIGLCRNHLWRCVARLSSANSRSNIGHLASGVRERSAQCTHDLLASGCPR